MNNVVNKQYKNSNKKSKYKYDYTTTTFYIIDNEPGYLYHYENNLANYCNIDDDIDINDNNKENFQNLVNTNKMVAKYYLDLNNNKNYFLNNEILKYNTNSNNNKFSGKYETNLKLFFITFLHNYIIKNKLNINLDSINLVEIYHNM